MKVDGAYALLHVRDTGVGISEAFRPHLFESFQQASSGLTRTHQGAGLGLAIAKRLAESMHGTLEVESTEGVGSVFTIRLPLAPSGDSGMGHHQRRLPWPESGDRTRTDAPERSRPVR
jgi:signal transduction histidine kinase